MSAAWSWFLGADQVERVSAVPGGATAPAVSGQEPRRVSVAVLARDPERRRAVLQSPGELAGAGGLDLGLGPLPAPHRLVPGNLGLSVREFLLPRGLPVGARELLRLGKRECRRKRYAAAHAGLLFLRAIHVAVPLLE